MSTHLSISAPAWAAQCCWPPIIPFAPSSALSCIPRWRASRAEISRFGAPPGALACPCACIAATPSDFPLPAGPCVVFLFNPFGAPVLRRLLRAWSRTLAERPGQLDILYVNNEQENVLRREPGFERLFHGQIRRSHADAVADRTILNRQPGAEYAAPGWEDCSIYRWIGYRSRDDARHRTATNAPHRVSVFQIVKLALPQYDGEVMNKPFAVVALFLPHSCLPFSLFAQAPSLTIQVDHPTATVSPTLYGLMTEEINYSYDGGLYGELVRDRTLGRGLGALRLLAHGGARQLHRECLRRRTTGPSAALTRSLRVTVSQSHAPPRLPASRTVAIGASPCARIPFTPDRSTQRPTRPDIPVTVSLQNDQTGVVAASATVTGVTSEWKQYTYTLKTGDVPSRRTIISSSPSRSRPRSGSTWSRSFRPPITIGPTAIASTSWRSSPPCSPNSCACPAAIILKATTSPSASTGRRPSAPGSTAPRT